MSIYDAIGGAPSVHTAVDKFYVRVLDDPQLAPFFVGIDMERLKSHQRKFIAAAIGGPELYQGRDMATAHADLGISDSDFAAVVGHLVDTLKELGVPEDVIGEIGTALAPLQEQIVTSPA